MAVRSLTMPRSFPSLDRRYILAGILAALAAALVLALTQPPDRTPVLVAASDLPSGHALTSHDVTVRYVDDPTGLVVGDSVGALLDHTVIVPLAEGEPLISGILRAPELIDAPISISLAVPMERAVLGRLGAGDVVDIYVTTSDPIDGVSTALVGDDVHVIDAVMGDDPGNRGDVHLLLAVDDHLAAKLASATHAGTVDVVRVGP